MENLEEYFTGPGGEAVGESDIPYYPAEDEGATESERRQEIINYELNRVEEQLVVAPGSVDRLSVAVLINGELESEEEAAISDFVAVAAGLDQEERRDQISVISRPYQAEVDPDDPDGPVFKRFVVNKRCNFRSIIRFSIDNGSYFWIYVDA